MNYQILHIFIGNQIIPYRETDLHTDRHDESNSRSSQSECA